MSSWFGKSEDKSRTSNPQNNYQPVPNQAQPSRQGQARRAETQNPGLGGYPQAPSYGNEAYNHGGNIGPSRYDGPQYQNPQQPNNEKQGYRSQASAPPSRNPRHFVWTVVSVKTVVTLEHAPKNYAAISKADFDRLEFKTESPAVQCNISIGFPQDVEDPSHRRFVVPVQPDASLDPNTIALTKFQRISLDVHAKNDQEMVGAKVAVHRFFDERPSYLTRIKLGVGTTNSKEETVTPQALNKVFKQVYNGQYLSPSQQILLKLGQDLTLKAMVLEIYPVPVVRADGSVDEHETSSKWWERGIVSNRAAAVFQPWGPGNPLKIFEPKLLDFAFEEMGIGGLDTEFSSIFRRAFSSRLFPNHVVEKLGIQHVRGMLLYGPPGTGKTLIARQIGKMLNEGKREPKIINGPEILNKYVGQSEENVRKMFADAEKEQKERGNDSELHIIIFDELDAVCKQRGSGGGGGTGVGDSVVNQLLTKLDGVNQLNNILLIGMTNRMDMIDEALLRAGRLEVHVEISLPDERGRQQILGIHTAKMRQNNVLDPSVDIKELAKRTKNFSGAEISGLVKAASSYAFSRHIEVGTMAKIKMETLNEMKVNMSDFVSALDEVKPLFGVSEEEITSRISRGIINFSNHIEVILEQGRLFTNQVRATDNATSMLSVLIHGPPGAGKTALAASIALESGAPFVKLISPSDMIGYGDMQKVHQFDKVFRDAYRSPFSVIVIDNIELILDWVPVGPRFSNPCLVALKSLLEKRPPKDRRLLVLATTTERTVLKHLNLRLNQQIAVPNVQTFTELKKILYKTGQFNEEDTKRVLDEIKHTTGKDDLIGVGVKDILLGVETAAASGGDDIAGTFAGIITSQIAENRGNEENL